jgi:hypothetical protein
MPRQRDIPLVDRFWSKVAKADGDECWEWQGARMSNGYGVIRQERRSVYTHRLSFMLLAGPIPPGILVCHTCDNRICVNPNHLFAGTKADNHNDMMVKGRQRPARGESVNTAKLTEDEVRVIRSQRFKVRSKELARQFGVSHHAISKIWRRVSWKSVA